MTLRDVEIMAASCVLATGAILLIEAWIRQTMAGKIKEIEARIKKLESK